MMEALKMIGMCWLALIITYGIIAFALIIIQSLISVLRRAFQRSR